jgi:K+-sensing histidine kinase KdpD
VTRRLTGLSRLSPPPFNSRWARYTSSAAIIAIIVAIRACVIPGWGSLTHPYLLFYPWIILTGWVGGFGPGLLATILAAFSPALLWLSPLYGFRIRRIEDPSGLMVFLAIGFAISFLNEARLQAKLRADAAEEEIRRRMRRSPGQLLDQLAASDARFSGSVHQNAVG